MSRVLGVLAGEDMPESQLRRWADSAEIVIAADSGADRLMAAGAVAHIIVGDMDSVTEHALRSAGEVHQWPDQDSTDCDKLLELARQKGFDRITLAAVEGSQPDHELSTLYSAARSPLEVRFAFRRGVGHIVKAELPFKGMVHLGWRVSLVPLGACENVDLTGVEWPLFTAKLDPLGKTSVSNVSTGGEVQCTMESGLAILYVECGPDPRWP